MALVRSGTKRGTAEQVDRRALGDLRPVLPDPGALGAADPRVRHARLGHDEAARRAGDGPEARVEGGRKSGSADADREPQPGRGPPLHGSSTGPGQGEGKGLAAARDHAGRPQHGHHGAQPDPRGLLGRVLRPDRVSGGGGPHGPGTGRRLPIPPPPSDGDLLVVQPLRGAGIARMEWPRPVRAREPPRVGRSPLRADQHPGRPDVRTGEEPAELLRDSRGVRRTRPPRTPGIPGEVRPRHGGPEEAPRSQHEGDRRAGAGNGARGGVPRSAPDAEMTGAGVPGGVAGDRRRAVGVILLALLPLACQSLPPMAPAACPPQPRGATLSPSERPWVADPAQDVADDVLAITGGPVVVTARFRYGAARICGYAKVGDAWRYRAAGSTRLDGRLSLAIASIPLTADHPVRLEAA